MTWAKDVQNPLHPGKHYHKGDNRVCIKHKERLISLIIYVHANDNDGKPPHKYIHTCSRYMTLSRYQKWNILFS